MSDHGHELLLAFDTDDPEFTRGVEAGVLWMRCQHEEPPVEAIVHATNIEMVMRIADAYGLTARAEPSVTEPAMLTVELVEVDRSEPH